MRIHTFTENLRCTACRKILSLQFPVVLLSPAATTLSPCECSPSLYLTHSKVFFSFPFPALFTTNLWDGSTDIVHHHPFNFLPSCSSPFLTLSSPPHFIPSSCRIIPYRFLLHGKFVSTSDASNLSFFPHNIFTFLVCIRSVILSILSCICPSI